MFLNTDPALWFPDRAYLYGHPWLDSEQVGAYVQQLFIPPPMFLPYPPLHSISPSPNHEASPPPGLQAALAAGASPPSSWIDPPAPPTNSSAMDTSRDGDFSSFPRDDVPPSPSYHEPQPLVSFFAGASGDPSARDPSPDRSTGASNTPEVPTAPAPTVTTASILPDDRAAATLLLSFGHPHLRIDQAPSNNPLDVIATNLWLPATGAAASLTVSNAPPSASSSFAPRPAASAATSSSERLLSLSAIARRLQRAFPNCPFLRTMAFSIARTWRLQSLPPPLLL